MRPQGITKTDGGVDVRVRAPHAEVVELCLFDGDEETRHELSADGDGNHVGMFAEVGVGHQYGLRVHGPWDPSRGLLHDPRRLLLDPFSRAVAGTYVDHPDVRSPTALPDGADTAPYVPRGVVVAPPPPPRPGPAIPWSDTVIYETHVRGLTMSHPDVPSGLRGTYLAAASDPVIDHLTRLGVTTVELLPVACHVSEPFLQQKGRVNYWGYSTLGWFAPHAGYATGEDGRQVAEFATMVDRFHAAGLEVILDVVFNHTAEGGREGPVLSMKGLDNAGWYRLEDKSRYVDWTGTGNTIDTGSEMVRSAILEALRWWTEALGVDGFRFDLAVTLGRADGPFDPRHMEWLSQDPVVGSRKLIAEPWDLGPRGYQLGRFGPGFAEWNGRYRDDIRDAWRTRSDRGALAARISGSQDLFGPDSASRSVNFVTAHDGFTLADLVAYDRKHNEANAEDNGDGHDDNRSWNSGVEGPTDDPAVREIRRRRSGGLLATMLMSRGVPMILGGDELERSQAGNNNAYSLDDRSSWHSWDRAGGLVDLVARAVRLRRGHPLLRSPHLTENGEAPPDVSWREPDGHAVSDWSAPGPLVAVLSGPDNEVLLAFNPTGDDVDLALPAGTWTVGLDSSHSDRVGDVTGTISLPAWTVLSLTR